MKNIQLTHRLLTIASYVEQNTVVADIGSDHGYIPIYLVCNDIVPKAYAMDINEGPIKSAKENVNEYTVTTVDVIQSDGLEKLEDDVESVVIAGMGGHLIKEILEKDKEKLSHVNQLVLSPHNDITVVRKVIHQLGFKIDNEDFIKDDHKHYHILVCFKGEETYDNELYYKYGKRLIEEKNDLYKKFLINKKKMYNDIMAKLADNLSKSATEKKKEISKALKEIDEVLIWLQN